MKPGETRNETRRKPGTKPGETRPSIPSIPSIPSNGPFLDSSFEEAGRSPHQFHQFRQTGLSGQFFRKGEGEAPINSINSVNSALSGEGVPTPHSVLATGLVSRDAQKFGISQACRLSGFEMPGRTIFGLQSPCKPGARWLRSHWEAL